MVTYLENGDLAMFKGEKFRRDKRTGYFLSALKHAGKRIRLHVAVWEDSYGAIPEGMSIHHIDHDKNNNEISNLQLIASDEHTRLHMGERTEEQKEAARRNIIEKGVPAAVKWHKSDAGHKWHIEHGADVWKNAKPIEYTCANCGKTFESIAHYSERNNKFCSNNCRAAFRRKSGVDNEVRFCKACGEAFTANKYNKTIYCSRSCAHKGRGKIGA